MRFCVDLSNFIRIMDDRRRNYDVISIFQDSGHIIANLLPFPVWRRLTVKKVITFRTLNFDKIFQSTAGILLLPFSENKRPPYRNSTSDFHLSISFNRHVILHRPSPNFMRIGRSATELWRHIDFPIWRSYLPSQIYFRSGSVTSYISEGKKLFAYQISTRHLNG